MPVPDAFEATLPLDLTPAALAAAPVRRPYEVLAVDDESNILNALRRTLRASGYAVTIADSGATALELMQSHRFDAVVSDMRMPGMSGAEFLRASRQFTPDAVRILLTGYADIASTIQAVNEGEIFRYLTKPWEDSVLSATLAEGLERREMQVERDALRVLTAAQRDELQVLNTQLAQLVEARTAQLMETMAQLQDAGTRLKSDFQATVRMLSSLVEPRAGLTAPCPRRIAKLARTVAAAMKLSADVQNDLMFAGLLGDLGKLGLPHALVGKPVASMDASEAAVHRAHPCAGEAYLMALPSLRNAGLLLGSLYENWDGSGTPAGLRHRQIAQGSRLLRVVTDYEHLLAGAIEYTPLTTAQAFGWLRRHRGGVYDPDCLDALLQVMNQPVAVRVATVRLRPVDLRAGMTTAQDLLSTRGVLLLGQDTVLTDLQIRQIRRLEEANGQGLWMEVKLDD